ncbi:MAG: hypothetical protein Q8O67_01835 [Deltaproteobacteria bacterium]|nr:hypothetical protein [Deltaproteobacteria bacterium]
MQAVDVSDPAEPRLTGSVVVPLSGDVVAFFANEGALFVHDRRIPDDLNIANNVDTLRIVDVVDRDAPRLAGTFELSEGPLRYAGDGDTVVAFSSIEFTAQLHTIDVTDVDAPILAATVPLGGAVRGLAMRGDDVYLAAANSGFTVVDVARPESPLVVGHIEADASHSFEVELVLDKQRRTVWASDQSIIDVLGAPVISGSFSFERSGEEFRDASQLVGAGDGVVFVVDGGLRVVDVSDPAAPFLVQTLDNGAFQLELAADGRLYAGLADPLGGGVIGIFDVDNPASLVRVGSIVTGFFRALDVQGTQAVVTAGDGVSVFDIAGDDGVELGRFEVPRLRFGSVARVGDLLYVAADGNGGPPPDLRGLYVVDVGDPAAPVQVGFVPRDLTANRGIIGGLLVRDGVLYANWGGLRVFDLGDPVAPADLGTFGEAGALAFHDDDLLVISTFGVARYDLGGDKKSPRLLRTVLSDRPMRGPGIVDGDTLVAPGGSAIVFTLDLECGR